MIFLGKPHKDLKNSSEKRDLKETDEVSFFTQGNPSDGANGSSAKPDSEDVSPTRVGLGGTQRRVFDRGSNTREESGGSSQHGHGGSAAPSWLARELHAVQTEAKVSTFIKASQYKNMRIPSADEFPSQPRGMHSYRTEYGSPAIPVPNTSGAEVSSSQRAPRQLLPTGTAHELLSRIRDEGACPSTSENPQAASRVGGPADLNQHPVTEPGPSLPCSANDVDEAALAAMSQATILNKGKGKAIVSNTSSVEAGPSNSHASTPERLSAVKGGSKKIGKGKGKAVTFGDPHVTPSASGSSTARVQEDNAVTVEYCGIRRGSPPFYVSSSGSEPTSGASGEDGGGQAGADARKESTSTWESTSGEASEAE